MTSKHGLKTAAGMRLSKLMRQVAEENTETEGLDPETGEVRVVTKAEALVRTIWKLALGYTEKETIRDAKTGRVREVVRTVKPDKSCIELIYERMEGKVSQNDEAKKKRKPLSSKLDDRARQRVSAIARGKDGVQAV